MKYFSSLLFLLCALTAFSQNENLGFGFRAGMSFAKIDGPSEIGTGGEELESNKMASGFHIGLIVNYKFTDLMGLRGEFLYSQRGTDYLYEGPSYYVLGRNTPSSVTLTGTRKQTINVSNSYIDIPLTVYYKIKFFEISGGLNTGLLIGSSGGGSVEFSGKTPNQGTVIPFKVNLNHNYAKDDAGDASPDFQTINADGFTYQVPTFEGAYYNFETKDKNFYKTLDFALNAGLSYFLNDGLFLGAKYIHGLGDVDNNENDVSLKELNPNGTHIQREDINKSTSWQFSVGFQF